MPTNVPIVRGMARPSSLAKMNRVSGIEAVKTVEEIAFEFLARAEIDRGALDLVALLYTCREEIREECALIAERSWGAAQTSQNIRMLGLRGCSKRS